MCWISIGYNTVGTELISLTFNVMAIMTQMTTKLKNALSVISTYQECLRHLSILMMIDIDELLNVEEKTNFWKKMLSDVWAVCQTI